MGRPCRNTVGYVVSVVYIGHGCVGIFESCTVQWLFIYNFKHFFPFDLQLKVLFIELTTKMYRWSPNAHEVEWGGKS